MSLATRLCIAGLPVDLRVRGPFDLVRFRHRFGPYERPASGPADASLRLCIEPQGKILQANVPFPGVQAYHTPQGDKFLRHGLSLWVGRDGHAEAFVRGPESFPPPPLEEDGGPAETPLRLLLSLRLLRGGRGALFHACGFLDGRGGLLFVGLSGAGKTTLAQALPPAGVLSDDQVALLAGPRLSVASTPFVGILGRTIAPREAPLRAVVVLDHERAGRLAPLSPREASSALLGCLPLYARAPGDALAALDLVARVARETPVFRGSFDQREGVEGWLARLP